MLFWNWLGTLHTLLRSSACLPSPPALPVPFFTTLPLHLFALPLPFECFWLAVNISCCFTQGACGTHPSRTTPTRLSRKGGSVSQHTTAESTGHSAAASKGLDRKQQEKMLQNVVVVQGCSLGAHYASRTAENERGQWCCSGRACRGTVRVCCTSVWGSWWMVLSDPAAATAAGRIAGNTGIAWCCLVRPPCRERASAAWGQSVGSLDGP